MDTEKNQNQSHNLYKLADGRYLVCSYKLQKPYVFPDLDSAAEGLILVGVQDDEIDFAVADMTIKNTTRANFGVLNGGFLFSDNSIPPTTTINE